MVGGFVHRALLDAARRRLDPSRLAVLDRADRETLIRRSREHGMHGLVAGAIRRTASLEPWAIPFIEQAIGVRESHLQHARTLKRATEALDGADVRRLLLKGASLVERYYGDEALRPYGDVDLLVPAHRFGDALDALEGAGFGLLDRNWNMLRADLRGQLHLRSPEGDVLELHWHPVNSRRVRRVLGSSPDDLWSGAERAAVAGSDVLLPRRSRELAYLCQHAAMHGCDRLIWLVDIRKAVADRDVDLDDVQRMARRQRFGAGTYLVLALVDRWLGTEGRLADVGAIRPDRATVTTFDRLVRRWDLGQPGTDAPFRQLLFATAADGLDRRLRLGWSLVTAPDVSDPDRSTPLPDRLRRLTVGVASRIRHKLDDHAQDGLPLEYRASGDPERDRARYLERIAANGA